MVSAWQGFGEGLNAMRHGVAGMVPRQTAADVPATVRLGMVRVMYSAQPYLMPPALAVRSPRA